MPRPMFKNDKPYRHSQSGQPRRKQWPEMTEKTETSPGIFRSGALSHRKPTRFRLRPEAAERADLAASLDLPLIARLSFEGEITPAGRDDFTLTARLVADVVQSCVVTLDPVPAKVDEAVTRRYLADFATPEGEEVEMPDDDSAEPLPEIIDLTEVMREALALALPPYPRATGAELGEAVFAETGTAPLRDADLKPFAALARLQKGAADGPEDGGE